MDCFFMCERWEEVIDLEYVLGMALEDLLRNVTYEVRERGNSDNSQILDVNHFLSEIGTTWPWRVCDVYLTFPQRCSKGNRVTKTERLGLEI